MAYAAVISLHDTVQRLLKSRHASIVASSREIIEFADNEIKSLQESLKGSDIDSRRNALDRQIREAVCNFEDLLESHLSDQVTSQNVRIGDGIRLTLDLQDLRQDVDSFIETVKTMLDNPLPEEEEEDASVSSPALTFGGKKSRLVGLSDLLRGIINLLTVRNYAGFPVVSLVGMGGCGKTTLAREVFEHPSVLECFDCRRVWVTVGRNYKLDEIARSILAQVDGPDHYKVTEWDEDLAEHLQETFKGKKYLIVLDDVWDTQVLDCLKLSFSLEFDRGSRVLLTTRLQQVHYRALVTSYAVLRLVPLLDKNESWDLLREKVFGEDHSCPPRLVKVGRKIADKCEGLPLMIVAVAGLLSEVDRSSEYWNEVAEEQNSLFVDAYDAISDTLFPSYQCLPQHLKPCFLHMGLFPLKYEIPRSKLYNMWVAEGFIEQDISLTLEECCNKYLEELDYSSLVITHERSSSTLVPNIKTCNLHSSLWHLCNRVAGENKFSHIFSNCADGDQGTKRHRRLCFHNNVLLGMEDLHNAVANNCASTARSLLCFGPYHPYPVPMYSELRLLRVLDALRIRLYEFPMDLIELVQLRYLALTCDGGLPTSISKLWNLQFLIIHRHLSITFTSTPSVPLEIWDMQELKHIQISGDDLPDSDISTASLDNLLTLLDVSAHSCATGVVNRVPNLNKLGIRIELVPDDDSMPFHHLNHIHQLHQLESLKCVLVNPELRSEVVPLPPPRSMFPLSLRKLHLSGMGYPWEYTNFISSLPYLNVLKLRHYAFQGPTWEISENQFTALKLLVLEDSDLVQWKVGFGSFHRLRSLTIKHCYQLEDLHWEFQKFFNNIQVVDCNPLAAEFLHRKKSRREIGSFRDIGVHVNSSWDDAKLPYA